VWYYPYRAAASAKAQAASVDALRRGVITASTLLLPIKRKRTEEQGGMMAMKIKHLASVIGGLALVAALCQTGLATHTIDLITQNSIPNYCQEGISWCAAATVQMILEGYPSSDHVYTQTHIYNTCQANNGDSVSWSPGTDPEGVRGTLMELGGDPGVTWIIVADPTKEHVMYWTVYYMTKYEYPTAVLVNTGNPFGSFDHWVAITGFTTGNDPVSDPATVLHMIDIFDPWNPPCPTASSGGLNASVTGSTWYGTYWAMPGNVSGSDWDGEYVVVVEPPDVSGVIRAVQQEFGPARIDPEEALEIAIGWVEEQGFAEREEYLALRVTVPGEPILVDREAEYGGSYYIVPFVYERTEGVRIAVLVNALTGEPQERSGRSCIRFRTYARKRHSSSRAATCVSAGWRTSDTALPWR